MTVKRRRYLTHTLFLTLIVSLCNAPDKIRAQHNFERDDHRATGPLTENALPIWELNILSQQRAKGDARQRFHSGLARFFASPSYSHVRSLAAGFARHSKQRSCSPATTCLKSFKRNKEQNQLSHQRLFDFRTNTNFGCVSHPLF